MTLDLTFFAMATLAVLFAGISKGGFGSGAAFAAAPFLALVMDPATAVAFMLPLLMIMDVTNLRPYWRKWNWPNARALMIGGIPGVGIGVLLFGVADPDAIRILIGLIALGFVAFQ
ncbi:MAG: TSUP family transporter, partial [Pseudomonadota bacterium]